MKHRVLLSLLLALGCAHVRGAPVEQAGLEQGSCDDASAKAAAGLALTKMPRPLSIERGKYGHRPEQGVSPLSHRQTDTHSPDLLLAVTETEDQKSNTTAVYEA